MRDIRAEDMARERREAAELQALGAWLAEQKQAGREEVPMSEINLVTQGIALGVKYAGPA